MRKYELTSRQQREKDEKEASRSNFSKWLLKTTRIDLCDRVQYISFAVVIMCLTIPIAIVVMVWWFRLWFMLL